MNTFMLPATRSYSPSHSRLRFAIDRFLAGKIGSMQLQSWCYAHFDDRGIGVDSLEEQFWSVTILNLNVFHRCDFHRSALEHSLRALVSSIDATGVPCVTPLTTSECCYEMLRRDRRSNDRSDQQGAIALGCAP